jgi:hypothetical protein
MKGSNTLEVHVTGRHVQQPFTAVYLYMAVVKQEDSTTVVF